MKKEKILVIDSEEDIAKLVRFHLMREGYEVTCAATGKAALAALEKKRWNLLILDLNLPEIDGFSVVKQVRNNSTMTGMPIIILSAKNEEQHVVAGLEIGIDDYIFKPFSPRILVARIRSVLLRSKNIVPTDRLIIERRSLVIDLRKHTAFIHYRPLQLTRSEFELLTLLASRPGWVFSRSQILDSLHPGNCSVSDRSVDVMILGLRRKLGRCRKYVETVRSVGYRFLDDDHGIKMVTAAAPLRAHAT